MKKLAVFAVLLGTLFSSGCPEGTLVTESSHGDAHGVLVVVDDSNFQEVVLQSDKPVLVDFWATWCGPCRIIAPVVEQLALDYEGRAIVAKLDVDTAEQTAQDYRVEAIPTLILFRNGEEVSRVVGAVDESELIQLLESSLQK